MKKDNYINISQSSRRRAPLCIYLLIIFPSMLALLIGIFIGRFIIPKAKAAEPDVAPVPATYQVKEAELQVPEFVSIGKFTVTGYCPCKKCCGKEPSDPAYKITISGEKTVEGITVGADPSVLPIGTKILIDGVGQRIVQDKPAGWIIKKYKGRILDLYFEDHQAAWDFGKHQREVWIIK